MGRQNISSQNVSNQKQTPELTLKVKLLVKVRKLSIPGAAVITIARPSEGGTGKFYGN